MKKGIVIFFGVVLVLLGSYLIVADYRRTDEAERVGETATNATGSSENGNATEDRPQADVETVAENLDIPWDLVFLPDGTMLVTERPGVLRKIGGEEFSVRLPEVVHIGEGGLLGITLHPNFKENNWLYLYFTTRTDGRITNMVQRYTLFGTNIGERNPIITGIPGASNHNGGRLAFGSDGFLYIATGDSENSALAQDRNSLAGKILRLDENGGIPQDNPFGNAVYSYGHRNPQGLAWDGQGRLWATEHGRSGLQSGLDELNLIEMGSNYGWPTIQGDQSQEGMKSPVVHSGAAMTWAPSGMAQHSGSMFFAGLRGQALYEAPINAQGTVDEVKAHFKGEFGRLRDVVIGPDGYFYLLTSNTDGRGNPRNGDDRIIRISEQAVKIEKSGFVAPMDQAEKRITKKTFGMYITPSNSPVQPDKFRGFHAGTDWEVFADELDGDVPVRAVCSGDLGLKKTASGYGGVVVQRCDLDGEEIMVIYGHMKLSSIKAKAGDFVFAGKVLGLLGDDKSVETDGARKHLHLAFHRGEKIDIKGYLSAKQDLADWLDPCEYVCKQSS